MQDALCGRSSVLKGEKMMGDAIVIIVVVICLALILAYHIRKKKKGETGCGCGCSGCSSTCDHKKE